MQINIIKRDGSSEPLDISKIQKQTKDAVFGLDGVSQSDLELDAKIQFVDGMKSSDIQSALIGTAVQKIDIDTPNYTFVAARLFLYDLYHNVGKVLGTEKGNPYGHLKDTVQYGIDQGRYKRNLADGYDLEDLNDYIKPERDLVFNFLGIKTAYDKYLTKNKKGECFELPQLWFMMIAMFLASKEENKQEKAKDFYDVISKFEVMLATPSLSGARKIRSQLSSCFIGSATDNIESIFDSYKEMALLSKFGGGIGWDWTKVRSSGSMIDNNKGAAGGIVPWQKITNDICIAVDQLGVRQGAIAVYCEPWHLDIKDFIDLKKNSGEERRRTHDLFPSLWLNDIFMKRVDANEDWTLLDPYECPDLTDLYGEEFEKKYLEYEQDETKTKITMKAKDLWKQILTNYYETGSPFLTYKDTANRRNPNAHAGIIRSTNLCTEIFQNTSPNKYSVKVWTSTDMYFTVEEHEMVQVLVGGDINDLEICEVTYVKGKDLTIGDIPLGLVVGINAENKTINIETFPKEYMTEIYSIEKEETLGETAVCNLASINLGRVNTKEHLERVIPIAINMLDNVVSLNFYPTKKSKDTNLKSRAIGLGIMGEAQMLAEAQIHFGSQEHFEKISDIMEIVSFNAIKASAILGNIKGSYPNFEGSAWSKGQLPYDSGNAEAKALVHGDKVYSEEEYEELRALVKNSMRNGWLMAIAPTSSISILVGTSQAIEPIFKRKWFEENLSGLIPVCAPNLSPDTWEYYTSAYDVDQMGVIKAAAIRQLYLDQGQSTNIFMRTDKASGKYLNDIYMAGWKFGLKSNYYLRSQSPEAKNDIEDRKMECAGCQ